MPPLSQPWLQDWDHVSSAETLQARTFRLEYSGLRTSESLRHGKALGTLLRLGGGYSRRSEHSV
jgi:hypothetical protein